ncbi:MAG: FMN-binding protein [Candidatus Binatia bacterium]
MSCFRKLLLAGAIAFLHATPGEATVFHARDEALELAFPDAERVEPRDFFLTPEQRSDIESRAKAPLESSFLTVYVGYRGAAALGYAVLDTHLVRTLPETFLVVISPDGKIAATHVLAFYEPLEYLPSDRWLRQFPGERLDDDLHVGRGIAGITGSTLTSRAVTAGIRRALAIYEVLLRDRD